MILRYLNKSFIINLILVFLIFSLDRLSKIYVIHLEKNSLSNELFSSNFLNIQLVWNEGIAFGLLSFDKENLYNFLTILIFFVILIICFMINKNVGIKKYSLIFILGGALGNIFDRIFYKAVPDFIDIHIGNFHWFIFNVSDIFITIGVIFMILCEFIVINGSELNEKN